MSLALALLEAGNALAEHRDIIEEVVNAVRGGTPKEAIIAAIKKVQEETSDAAIREELESAEQRKRGLGV